MQIYYPLHPLSGHQLWVRERRAGPPPTYYVITPSGEGFSVPVWMTDMAAANLRQEDGPRIDVRVLLEIVALLERGLESFGLQDEILPSDQAKEIPDDDRTTPVILVTERQPESTTSGDAGGPKREQRVDSDDAAPRRSRPEGARRQSGGLR